MIDHLENLPSNYTQRIRHISILTLSNQFKEAINSCNQLIEEIKPEFMKKDNYAVIVANFYPLLKYCMETNKQNYWAWFETVFQHMSQQKNNDKELSNFFMKKLIEAKSYTDARCYHQAICICSALTQWLNRLLITAKEDYQILLQPLLTQCNIIYEYTYLHWLRLDYQSFINYHYQDSTIRQKINKELSTINQHFFNKNYPKAVYHCTKFIAGLDGFLAKACETANALTFGWQKFAAMQRQQILFGWLINNNDCLDFDQHVDYIEMLRSDLALLAKAKYFTEPTKLEAQCRLNFISLLFEASIKRDEFCELRRKFCIAFDNFNHEFNIFNQGQENENIALALLGLAILNAYEGNKQEMLIGLRSAVQYNNKLKNLTQTIIRRLPFYMEQRANNISVLVNPLVQSNLPERIEPLALKRK